MISFPFHIHMSDKNFDYMVESVKMYSGLKK